MLVNKLASNTLIPICLIKGHLRANYAIHKHINLALSARVLVHACAFSYFFPSLSLHLF